MEKVIRRIERIPLTPEMQEVFDNISIHVAKKMKQFITALCEELFNSVIYDKERYIDEIARGAKQGLTSFDISYFANAKLGHLAAYLNNIKIKELDVLMQEKSEKISEKLTDGQRKAIMDFFELNKNAPDQKNVPDRARGIMNEIKIGFAEVMLDESKFKYIDMAGLFDLISLDEDEQFNLYMVDGAGGEEPIKGTQVIDFFAVLKQTIEDYL